MNITGKQIVAVVILAVLIAAGWTAKAVWLPTVDEKYFLPDYQRLQNAPAHILILRLTQFPESRRTGGFAAPKRIAKDKSDPQQMRAVGRNVSLSQLIAIAYQCPEAQVLLPPLAATNHYDFLVTATHHPMEQLHAAIKKQLGYTASQQPRPVDTLVLTVRGSGPSPSTASEQNFDFKNGTLYIRHVSIQRLVGMARNGLKEPIVDQTGLTGFYDFSMPWKGRNNVDLQTFKDALMAMGISAEDSTQTVQMMVVENAK